MAQENELLSAVLSARQKVAEIDASLSEAKSEKDAAEAKLIEYMDDSNLKSFKSSTLNCSCIRKETLYVSVNKDEKDEAFRWIEEDCGRPDLLKMTVHNRTLSSFIGEMLKKGEKIPSSLFSYFFKPELTIIQAKIS